MFEARGKVIEINGISVPVNPDFRIMCRFGAGKQRGDAEMMKKAAEEFYFAGFPEGITPEMATEGMVDFYCTGMQCSRQKYTDKSPIPTFDFEEDETYFYAAFLENYRIDLMAEKLHWFDFCRLFFGLPDECRLRQIIGIRAVKLSDITSKSEKRRIARLKEVYALEFVKKRKPKSLESRNAAMRDRLIDIHKKMRQRSDSNG